MEDLKNLLRQTGRKLLFVGIGNVLKQDDGVGVYISRRIESRKNIDVITAEVSIENYIGKINSLKPDILIIIDALEMGMPPGTYRLLPLEVIVDLTFNTHNISLRRLSDFFSAEVYILGIQPASIDFGEKTSYLVKREANKIINLINKQEVYYGS